jgi:hypothetical protein
MQIEQSVWRSYFEALGWDWHAVIHDLDTHFRAARHIYDRAGGFTPWSCY